MIERVSVELPTSGKHRRGWRSGLPDLLLLYMYMLGVLPQGEIITNCSEYGTH